MKKIFIILLIYITSFVLNASGLILNEKEEAWIKKHPIITLGSDTNWSPFIINNNGKITGYDKDVLNLINKKTKARIIFKI